MVHYGTLSGGGAAIGGLQLNGGGLDLPQPLNYMRSNGAALLVAAVDAVDQQQQQQQQPQGKARAQFFCDQCDMVFGSKSAHTSHMKSHLKYATAATSAIASGSGDGSQAQAAGTPNVAATPGGGGSDPYQCDKCNKTFAVPARLVSKINPYSINRITTPKPN